MSPRVLRRQLLRTLRQRRRELQIDPVRATARRYSLANSFWFFMLFALAWIPATRFIDAWTEGHDPAPGLGCFLAYQTAFLLGGIAHFADVHNRARGWLQAWLPFSPEKLWRLRWKEQRALWLGFFTWVPMLIVMVWNVDPVRGLLAGLLFIPALYAFAWGVAIRFPFNMATTGVVTGFAYLFGLLAFLGLQGPGESDMWGWATPLLVLLAELLQWITPTGWWWMAVESSDPLLIGIGFGLLLMAAMLLQPVRARAMKLFERTHFEEAEGDALLGQSDDEPDEEEDRPPFPTPLRDASTIRIEPLNREAMERTLSPPIPIPDWMTRLLIVTGVLTAGWVWLFEATGLVWLIYLGGLAPWVLLGASKLTCETGTAIQPTIQIPAFALLPLDLEALRQREENNLRRWLLRTSPYWVIYTVFGSWIFEAGWGAHLAFAMGLVIWTRLAHRATFSWSIAGRCRVALSGWRGFLYEASRLLLGLVVLVGGVTLFVTPGVVALDPPTRVPWVAIFVFSSAALITWSAAWSSWTMVSQGLANGWLDQVSPTPTAAG